MEIAAPGTRHVYDFAEGSREMRELLGAKGANVAEIIGDVRLELRHRSERQHGHRMLELEHGVVDAVAEVVDAKLAVLAGADVRSLRAVSDPFATESTGRLLTIPSLSHTMPKRLDCGAGLESPRHEPDSSRGADR